MVRLLNEHPPYENMKNPNMVRFARIPSLQTQSEALKRYRARLLISLCLPHSFDEYCKTRANRSLGQFMSAVTGWFSLEKQLVENDDFKTLLLQ